MIGDKGKILKKDLDASLVPGGHGYSWRVVVSPQLLGWCANVKQN